MQPSRKSQLTALLLVVTTEASRFCSKCTAMCVLTGNLRGEQAALLEREVVLTGDFGGEEVAALEGVDGAQGLQRPIVVPHQRVHAQQADQAEVAHHAQHVGALVVALRRVEVLLPGCSMALQASALPSRKPGKVLLC